MLPTENTTSAKRFTNRPKQNELRNKRKEDEAPEGDFTQAQAGEAPEEKVGRLNHQLYLLSRQKARPLRNSTMKSAKSEDSETEVSSIWKMKGGRVLVELGLRTTDKNTLWEAVKGYWEKIFWFLA